MLSTLRPNQTKPLNRPLTLPKCERTMNKKIATQLAQMDRLMFDLRMSLSALQSELHQSATFSTKVPMDQYNTARFETTESHVEPDGFHGKSYKDFEKHEEEQ